jgi:lysophospholipase L1-like esterase
MANWFRNKIKMFRMIMSALSQAPDAWEWAIAEFEAEDRANPPGEGRIVFTGSSSITLWETLKTDMAPLPVLNRGFGGSRIDQVVQYVDRIVLPYRPRAVVLFAGTNDISGPKPKSAQAVLAGFQAFVSAVHSGLPGTPIYFISITPTPARWELWPVAQEANQLIQAFIAENSALHYIDLVPVLLTAQGLPDAGLYQMDKLHPNVRGYARWTAVIRPILEAAPA